MYLPNNDEMLLSVINTLLRDKYSSLDDLCYDEDVSLDYIKDKLDNAGYVYNKELNAFVVKNN